jgi:hypothetical protein
MPKELGIEVTMTASGKSRTAHAAAAMAALLVCDLTRGAGNLAGSRLSGGESRRTIDRICRTGCVMLEVQETRVQLIDQWLTRNLNLGPYIAAAQHLVPPTEAPISDLQTPEGWRVVTSLYLDHKEKNASTHIRFFHPDGRLRSTETALESVEQTEIGALFGGTGEIFATNNGRRTRLQRSDGNMALTKPWQAKPPPRRTGHHPGLRKRLRA